jgi:rubrerythrin
MSKYKVDEILEHAMNIEEAGQKFYAMLADRLDDPPLKKIFSIMSRQEVGHLEIYKKLREQLPAKPDDSEDQADPFDDVKHEMLEDKIFNRLDVVRKATGIHYLGEALALMIDVEMNVVDYFENICKQVNHEGQQAMQRIINEEKTHVKQLVDLRTQYKAVVLR